MKIGLIGTGAYGQALSLMLNKNNNNVVMWTSSEEKYNEYLDNGVIPSMIPDVVIPKVIKLTNSIEEVCKDKDIIFITTTATYVGKICQDIKPYIKRGTIVAIASKGIENNTCKFLSDIAKEVLKIKNIVIISGPSFAIDMANNKPVALSVASNSKKAIKLIKKAIVSDTLKLRDTSDLKGIQICGSIKNVIAVATGILAGMGYPESTISFLITESLHDIKELIKAVGGNPKTILSYAGVGDLVLTCTSPKSRNYKFGKLVGERVSKDEKEEFLKNNTVEGYYTLKSIYKLIKKERIKIPLIDIIYKIIIRNEDPENLVKFLINKK